MNTIRAAELHRLGSNAWGLEREERHGWVLRAAGGGFTHRANSVLPTQFASTAGVGEAISDVEDWYEKRGSPAIFQVFEGITPEGLRDTLVARHYDVAEEHMAVLMTMSLERPGVVDPEVQVSREVTAGWVVGWLEADDASPEHAEVTEAIVASSSGARAFVAYRAEGTVASTAYGCIEDGWLGVFCLATHPDHRRRGLARSTMNALHAWGLANGANNAYLQVAADNEAAQALYADLGYRQHSRYGYLSSPQPVGAARPPMR